MARKTCGASPLTLRERSIIEIRWCRDNKSVTHIAVELRRNKSSVSRELKGKPRKGMGRYNAERMHAQALERIERRGNTPKTKRVPKLKTYIEDKIINEQWSPEQVSIRLPIEFKEDTSMRIATESIYQEVYRRVHRGGNGAVKKGMIDLRSYLARRHKRRAKKGFRKARRMEIKTRLPSIDQRPKAVDTRAHIGHWEDDTMVSRQSQSRLKTVTERVSGIHLIAHTKDGTAEECDRVLVERLGRLPESVRKTLTRDRGTENLRWKEVEKELNIKVHFAHAYASHERGTNENSNGLVRRYIPKKSDFNRYSDEQLTIIEYKINNRPRKRHGGLTPVEVLFKTTGVALYS